MLIDVGVSMLHVCCVHVCVHVCMCVYVSGNDGASFLYQVIPGTMDRGKATGAPLFMPFKQVAKQATLSGPQVNVKSAPPPSYDAHRTSRSQAPPSRSQAGRSVQRGGGGAQQHTRHKHTPTPKIESTTSSSDEKGAGTRQQHTLPGSVGGDGTRPPPHPPGEGRRPQMGSLAAIAAENSLRMSAGRPERGRGLRTGRTELDDGEERRGRRGRGRRGSRDDEHTSSKGEYQLSDWFSQALHLDTAGEEQEESSNVTSAGFEERGGYYEGEGPREPMEDSSWSGRPRRGRGRGQREERGRGGRRGRRGRGGYQRGGEQDLTKSVQEVPYSGEGEVWPTLQGTHAPLSRANDGSGGGQGSEIWGREKPAGKEEGTKGSDPVAAKQKDGGRRGREAAEKKEELYIWEDELIYYEDDVVSEAWPTLQGSNLPSSDGDQRAGERGVAQKSGELWRVKPTGVDRGVKEQDAVKGKKGTNKDGGQAGQWRGDEEPEVWESELYFEDVSEAWPTLQGKPLDSSKDGGSGRQDAAGNWDWVSCKGVPSSAKKVLS